MAFNPFESFRKNSKALFALMAIVCMFTFVLSAGIGKGDFFDWLARQFGEGRRGPEASEIATYYGSPITFQDLEDTNRRRTAANLFMFEAVHAADMSKLTEIGNNLRAGKYTDDKAVKAMDEFFLARKKLGDLKDNSPTADQQAYREQYDKAVTMIEALAGRIDENAKPEDFKAISRLNTIEQNEARRRMMGAGESTSYFISYPNRDQKDRLVFAMMMRKADKIGLKLSEDAVRALIARETDNYLSEKDAGSVEALVRNRFSSSQGRGISTDDLFSALGDEFRARIVVAILRGDHLSPDSPFSALPEAMSPWDFFKYYQDQCSESSFAVVEVPVESFLADVKTEPSTKELQNLFARYSRVEAMPFLDSPGFKQPRKAITDFLVLDPKSAFYEKYSPLNQATSTIAAGVLSTFNAGGPVASAMQVAQPFIAAGLPVQNEVEQQAQRSRDRGFPSASSLELTFRDNTIYSPVPFAALAGQLAFPGSIANFSAAAANQYNLIYSLEVRDRVKFGMPAFLGAYGWGGLPLTVAPSYPLTAIAPAAVGIEAPMPKGVYRQRYLAEVHDQRMRDLCVRDREKFILDLKLISAKIVYPKPDAPDTDENKEKRKKADEAKVEAMKYIDDFAKARGLTVTHGKTLLDQSEVASAPELKPLSEAAQEARRTYLIKLLKPIDLPRGFDEVANSIFGFSLGDAQSTVYLPGRFPDYRDPRVNGVLDDASDKLFVVWRTEDQPAKEYKKYDEMPQQMKDRVIKAWKMEKARDLAKANAELLAIQIQTWAGTEIKKNDVIDPFDTDHPFRKKLNDQVVQFTKEYNKPYRVFDLTGMALKKQQTSIGNNSLAGTDRGYAISEIPERDVLYPTRTMAQELLALRTKPVGETVIVPDMPKKHYYAACFLRKNEKDVGEFAGRVYFRSSISQKELRDYAQQINSLRQRFGSSNNFTMMAQFAQSQFYQQHDTLFVSGAQPEVLQPGFENDFIERLKAEGDYKGNPELEKQLESRKGQ